MTIPVFHYDLNNPPRETKENLIYRRQLLAKAKHSPLLQNLLIEKCRRDILFWFDTFAFTYDPRKVFYDNTVVPFIPFQMTEDGDGQRTFILKVKYAIENQEDLVLEKSRDEGATWMMLSVYWWFWRFVEGADFLLGSMDEMAIHRAGDRSTLFPKLFFISENTPDWLLPKGYNPHKHESFMKLINPEIGNTIVGKSGKSFGTSGRYMSAFMDEASKWDDTEARVSFEALQQATPCRILGSTPFGQYGLYYSVVSNTTETAPIKARIHWSDDPRKTKDIEYLECESANYAESPTKNELCYARFKGNRSSVPKSGFLPTSSWYRRTCKKLMADPEKGDDGIKQELDIEYLGTGRAYFDQDIVNQRKNESRPPLAKGDLIDSITDESGGETHWLDKLGKVSEEIVFEENSNGLFWVWEFPKDPKEYLDNQLSFSCDPAKGLTERNDFTSITVRDRLSGNTLARFLGRIQFVEDMCEKIFVYYHKKGYFCVDATGNSTVAEHVQRKGIPLIVQKKDDKISKGVSDTIGFVFTTKSKPSVFLRFKRRLAENTFNEPDERFWLQMQSFINDKGVLKGAGKGEHQSHDDMVDDMALNLYCDEEMPDLQAQITTKRRAKIGTTYTYDGSIEEGHVGEQTSKIL